MPRPSRPRVAERLRPGTILIRPAPGVLQLSLDDKAVRIRDLGEPLQRFLTCLDGRSDPVDGARRSGLSRRAAREILAALDEAELLDRPSSRPAVVAVVGAGPLGTAIARLLRRPEIGLLAVSDLDAAEPDRARILADRWQADPTTGAQPLTRVVAVDHWSKPDGTPPAVTVVAIDGPEGDRLVPEALRREGRDHLLVRLVGTGVRVGPFVTPGDGPCLRCCDLLRRGHNPHWPATLDQLRTISTTADPLALAWGAATAAAQVVTRLGGARPETWSASLELGPPDWTVRLRRWRPHPACDCATPLGSAPWPAKAQWEA